ncbi:MAG: hypothetical protein VR64_09240 [Desulfatitalea sp. BRH_c12]|nr:MAG: hypothetical protein VR64_09240 [Desulfatitalea sp. BRH_c12]
MSDLTDQDQIFAEIALQKHMIAQDKLERALLIQRCIANRTQVYMPIGSVLEKMGLLGKSEIDQILAFQNVNSCESADAVPIDNVLDTSCMDAVIDVVVSPDKMSADIIPTQENQPGPPLEVVKELLVAYGIAFGMVSDTELDEYLKKSPLPMTPFTVARGVPPEQAQPPEIRYYFDTDPLRIGTLLEDGTMDWKNRGDIPQVQPGDLLAEKVGGHPGRSGTNVLDVELLPARVKAPQLKFSKGAERSEDGRQILAKVAGRPNIGPDGRIGVCAVLPIETDVGIETGNIEFDGNIEVNGGIADGYTVKGRSLSTREIQNAGIELTENLVCLGGIYGSKIIVGGHLKASHIHNSTIEVIGDLVVEKEIFGCTITVNGCCMIAGGKIIASQIAAKKGIQVKDIGTPAARPSNLTVGVDFKFERDMLACKGALAEFEDRRAQATEALMALKKRMDQLDAELGQVAQAQDGSMVQKRQLEEKLKSAAKTLTSENRARVEGLIADLAAKYDALDARVKAIMAEDDFIRVQVAEQYNNAKNMAEKIEEVNAQISVLEEAAKIDTGIPVVKVSGVIYSKTTVSGPHKKVIIPQEMYGVRIAEVQEDTKLFQMTISSLK